MLLEMRRQPFQALGRAQQSSFGRCLGDAGGLVPLMPSKSATSPGGFSGFIPARIRVLRHIRPQYACPCCKQSALFGHVGRILRIQETPIRSIR